MRCSAQPTDSAEPTKLDMLVAEHVLVNDLLTTCASSGRAGSLLIAGCSNQTINNESRDIQVALVVDDRLVHALHDRLAIRRIHFFRAVSQDKTDAVGFRERLDLSLHLVVSLEVLLRFEAEEFFSLECEVCLDATLLERDFGFQCFVLCRGRLQRLQLLHPFLESFALLLESCFCRFDLRLDLLHPRFECRMLLEDLAEIDNNDRHWRSLLLLLLLLLLLSSCDGRDSE